MIEICTKKKKNNNQQQFNNNNRKFIGNKNKIVLKTNKKSEREREGEGVRNNSTAIDSFCSNKRTNVQTTKH